MSLVEQGHRFRSVDVERGGAAIAPGALALLELCIERTVAHAADAIRSPWIVEPNVWEPRDTSTASANGRDRFGASAPPDGVVTEPPIAADRSSA